MRFRELPLIARAYVVVVMIGGAVAVAASLNQGAFSRPLLLVSFVAASIAVHTFKFSLSGSAATSTSMGFAVSFASLLVLGPWGSVWTLMAGGWAQTTFNTKTPNPWYRVLFTMAALVLSIQATAQTLAITGGTNLDGAADIVIPSIAAAALVYFIANTALVAAAIGLTSGQSIIKTWDQEFLWGAPNYLIGALAATVAVQSVTRYGLQAVALLVAPLYLTYRLYRAYLDRVDSMARKNRELHTLYERAHAESLTDALTELPNRRFITSHAATEIARARREGYEVAFLLIDIDEFKSINDRYGHQQGDVALRTVAGCLRKGLRSYDVCGRYAGDEFVLILSRCNSELAQKRAAELAESVANRLPDSEYPVDRPLSISIGASVFPADGTNYEELIAVADSRMYARKHRRVRSQQSSVVGRQSQSSVGRD
jgi:diguanylate cyclase (GGDEF)-like protein